MSGKPITITGILILACAAKIAAADNLSTETMEQPDAYRLQMQQQLQSMTPEERALYQSMNQLRSSNQNRNQSGNSGKGKGNGSHDGSGKKYRHGQNGSRGKGGRQGRF